MGHRVHDTTESGSGSISPHDKSGSVGSAGAASTISNKRPAAASEEESRQGENDAPVKPRRKRKHRKGTYTLRREEKERLMKETERLNAKVVDLKQRAIAAGLMIDKDRIAQTASSNVLMRCGLKRLQLTYNEISAAMSEYAICNMKGGSPLHDPIFLRKDSEFRRETLFALKADKLRHAQRFLQLRRPAVDPRKVMVEDQHFETEDGDLVSTRFSITQFNGVRSVKQVFNLLHYFYCNMEISVSEKLGHITVREDDDSPDKGITQNRLMSVTSKGIKMDSNMVIFSEYSDRGDVEGEDIEGINGSDGGRDRGDRGYGFIVLEFVDDDERHPYQSDQRVRKDLSGALEICAYPQTSETTASSGNMTVVLTKWVHNRLHHPAFPMQPDRWLELHDTMDLWGQAMQRSISEGLQN